MMHASSLCSLSLVILLLTVWCFVVGQGDGRPSSPFSTSSANSDAFYYLPWTVEDQAAAEAALDEPPAEQQEGHIRVFSSPVDQKPTTLDSVLDIEPPPQQQMLRFHRVPSFPSSSGPTVVSTSSSDRDTSEPTCQELRTIWHLTKRAARRSLLTNEIPTQPTSMFGYFVNGPGGVGGPRWTSDAEDSAFGRIVLGPTEHSGTPRWFPGPSIGKGGKSNTLRGRTAGSFERVKEELMGLFAEAEKPYKQLGGKMVYHHRPPPPPNPVYAKPMPKYAKSGPRSKMAQEDMVYGMYSGNGGLFLDDDPVRGGAPKKGPKMSSSPQYPWSSSKPSMVPYRQKHLGPSDDTFYAAGQNKLPIGNRKSDWRMMPWGGGESVDSLDELLSQVGETKNNPKYGLDKTDSYKNRKIGFSSDTVSKTN